MDDRLANPYWHALLTEQARFAVGGELARRFAADVIPFAGVVANERAPLLALRALLAKGESLYLTSDSQLGCDGLQQEEEIPGLQMVYEPGLALPRESEPGVGTNVAMDALGAADVPDLLRLKELAFPGFFEPRASSLGKFFGVRVDGALAAMAGERLALPGLREISAVCTHPDHTGKGYAAMLIRHLIREHERAGLRSFLHVVAVNTRAIALYRRLGFAVTRELPFRRIQRTA